MESLSDIEPKHFSFRLFLDDYLLKGLKARTALPVPAPDCRSGLLCRLEAGSPPLYYSELEELETFCCLDDECLSHSQATRESSGNGLFSLASFQPKRDCASTGFSDFISAMSFGSLEKEAETRPLKTLSFESLELEVRNAQFRQLRTKLASFLRLRTRRRGGSPTAERRGLPKNQPDAAVIN